MTGGGEFWVGGEVTDEQREAWLELYSTDDAFHAKVDRLLWDEVEELRLTLRKLGQLRRDDFLTGFHYEVEVRKLADEALARYPQIGAEVAG